MINHYFFMILSEWETSSIILFIFFINKDVEAFGIALPPQRL